MYLEHEGRYWVGVIDLVLAEDSVVTAVDYKVMAAPDPLPENYQQQQRIYTEALRRLLPKRQVGFEFWWLGGR